MEPIDLLLGDVAGPVFGTATEDLNLTLLSWPAGHTVPGHVNAERDVAFVVVAGSVAVEVDGVVHAVHAPSAFVVPKGARRELRAGAEGVRYVAVHRARGGLSITRMPPSPAVD